MSGRGNWGGGPYADDEYRAASDRGDKDYVYPSESGRQWQPGWDLGRRNDGEGPGYEGHSPDSYPDRGYEAGYSDSYDQYGGNGHSGGDYAGGDSTGSDYAGSDYAGNGYAGNGYGTADYGSAGYGGTDYEGQGGEYPSQGHDGYNTYGGDQYADGGYGDQGGSFARADSGWFDRPDTGSFGRPDTGSFGRPDTGSFGRPDTGSFGRADDYQNGDYQTGSQPAGGYDQWHYGADDADADRWDAGDTGDDRQDWQDDRDSGLLSRRFGNDDDGDGSRRGRRAGRVKRQRRGRGRAAFTASIVVVAVVVVAGGVFGLRAYSKWYTDRYGDYSGAGTGSVQVTVQEGASLGQLGPELKKLGVIMELGPFNSAANKASNAGDLQPGVYKLHLHMSSAIAVSYLLSAAHRIKDQVTLVEGMRASAIAAKLATQTGKSVADFNQIIEHPPASLGLPSWAPKGVSAEGFLFPDTYTLLPSMTPLQILQMMVKEFNDKVDSINLTQASKHVFTTPWHALIVASLIQAEAGNVSDFKKISRVAWNRIGKGMPLQFDSTIFYALHTYGTAANSQQQKVKSPYNTYANVGFPPGPISNPGLLAIEAAVHPAEGADKNLLYFITDTRKKPYVTHFTDSLTQLQQWQQEFGN